MEGVDDEAKPELRGIMLNVFDFVFDQIQDDKDGQREYLVYITYLEIYNEDIKDLLVKDSPKLQLKEGPNKVVYVNGLRKVRRSCRVLVSDRTTLKCLPAVRLLERSAGRCQEHSGHERLPPRRKTSSTYRGNGYECGFIPITLDFYYICRVQTGRH
jgi:hypothetical protein